MANLYADENFPALTVRALRVLGHNVLTSREAGQANQGISDEQVLVFARTQGRALLTHDRFHYKRLHRDSPDHAGIIVCTEDADFEALAERIDHQLKNRTSMDGQLISVTRGQ